MAQEKKVIYKDPNFSREERIKNLMDLLTLEEKIRFLYHTADDVPRLGIRHYYHGNEALHGVVRPGKATVFPQAIAFGATWDPDLILRVATAISDEARTKHHNEPEGEGHSNGLLTFWSPTVNMARDPRWGRTPETYGEDTLLTSRTGISFVRGLQGDDPNYLKVVSTPKHFAANNEEHNRLGCNPKISHLHLREYFLPQFRALITEGKARSIMSAYNRVLGVPCSASHWLLTEVLRNEWGFKGYVVTDCGAIWNLGPFQQRYIISPVTGSALAINAGVDLECGDNFKRGWLLAAVKKGLVKEETIDRALRNVLRAYFDLGMFDPQNMVPYSKIPYSKLGCKEHSDLAYQVAVKSMVLLKNQLNGEGRPFLPLNPIKLKTIAIIGPNADHPIFGDYSGTPVNPPVSPLDGIKKRFSSSKIIQVPWISPKEFGRFREISTRILKPKPDCPKHTGLKLEIYPESEFKGTPITLTEQNPSFDWRRRVDASVSNAFSSTESGVKNVPETFSVKFSGCIEAEFDNEYLFKYTIKGGSKPVIKIADVSSNTGSLKIKMEKGKSYSLSIEIPKISKKGKAKFEYRIPELETSNSKFKLEKDAARSADVVIAFVGIDTNTEREGKDKESLAFPKEQIDLLKSVVAINRNIVAFVISGSPLELGYLHDNLPAVVQAWYPGERGGDAIASLLAGDENFSGKLPMTFFKSTSQLPPISDYDLFKGRTYMYFDGDPQYEFGFGLSYTEFQYENFKIEGSEFTSDDTIKYSVDLTNVGARAGEEIVQVYVKYKEAYGYERAKLRLPNLQLKDFKRVFLKEGEKKTVQGEIKVNSIEFFEEKLNKYVVLPGTIEIMIGKSCKRIEFSQIAKINQ